MIGASYLGPLVAFYPTVSWCELESRGKHIVFLAGDHEYRSEESLPALARILAKHYGFKCSFNPTFAVDGSPHGWISKEHFALDQGPVILMIENYRSGLIWRLLRRNPYIVAGLRRAGFRGGWLNGGDSGA